jgi:hypothetical protein
MRIFEKMKDNLSKIEASIWSNGVTQNLLATVQGGRQTLS